MKKQKKNRKSPRQNHRMPERTIRDSRRRRFLRWTSLVLISIMIVSIFAGFFVVKW
ncbi:hypothetical protein LSG31_04990 [Fodinisporobacter ferrooxydans]|uniref:Uncharacterized protein n=1 Tax=Fodinisporobacter ferrooxydans TaxID=2901836 RepID=A0ABY4CNN3_9BACL|nr:hypothetical protein LSG31_04990 [Alicyclobacillaceae bacterium MYW30-H2]